MEVLVVERERHFNADDLRRLMPGTVIHDAKTAAEALAVAAGCDVLVALAHNVTDDLVAAMPKLGYIVSLSAGVDHLWTLRTLRPHVRITNGRGIHGPQMAEMAFLYMIGLSRDYRRMEANQRAHVWDRWAQPVLLDKSERFGGNSRGEAWENVEYTIGAAYFANQEPGAKLYPLYQQAGIFPLCRKRHDSDHPPHRHHVSESCRLAVPRAISLCFCATLPV